VGKSLSTSHHVSDVFSGLCKGWFIRKCYLDLKPCETDLRHVLASGAEGRNNKGNGISRTIGRTRTRSCL
jgi:hypothetical protein